VPGTAVSFNVELTTPPTVPALATPQIFTFVLRVLGDGTSVISETPVVVVVPERRPIKMAGSCVTTMPPASVPPARHHLGQLELVGRDAGDSRIDFEVAVARSMSELGNTPFDRLEFTIHRARPRSSANRSTLS